MSFFRGFPTLGYYYGNESSKSAAQNLSAYSDIVDHVRDNATVYENYEILDGERPDTLSIKLYGNMEFYWTFFLMNEHIRKNGFPISNKELTKWTKKQFPNTVLTTKNLFFDKMFAGDIIVGQTSGTVATIKERNLDLGQIVVSGTKAFSVAGEVIQKQSDATKTVTIESSNDRSEHLALKYYTNSSGERVDVDPQIGTAGVNSIVTNLDYYTQLNDSHRTIRTIKKETISQVHAIYKKSLIEV